MPATRGLRVDALAAFKASPLFAQLDRRALRALAEAAQRRDFGGGETLYRPGEAGEALFLVINGRIRLSRRGAHGRPEVVDEVGRGLTVGESALLIGEPHQWEALALRDSGTWVISKATFERLVQRHPAAMLALVRQVVDRQRGVQARQPKDSLASARCFAVVPLHEGIDVDGFTRALVRQFAGMGAALRLDPVRVDQALGPGTAQLALEAAGHPRLATWLHHLETAYRYLVYQASRHPDAWTQRCLRQADRVLLLVHGARAPVLGEMLRWSREAGLQAPVEIVLLHDAERGRRGSDALGWRGVTNAVIHHHVPSHLPPAAMARVARLATGRGLCLALGGGGARGFAHLGLLRALAERGLAVDAVAGNSMGALVGGMVASGMDVDAVLKALRETFVAANYLNDYSFSRVALIGGRKFRARLNEIFGDARIEDLAIPFFCESANLSRGVTMVHDRGRLTDWIATSMAVPGVAPPVVYRGELLVDGGLLRSVPFDTIQSLGRGPVVVSDVSRAAELRIEGLFGPEPTSLLDVDGAAKQLNLFKILFHTATLTSERESAYLARRADLVLRMPVDGIGMFDWERMDDIVYRAYHYADQALDTWLGERRLAPSDGAENG